MLSRKAKYALRALLVLARSSNRVLGCRAIAQAGCIPEKFLENIVQELRAHRIVKSKRGIFGGYSLAAPPEDISIGQVLRIIDGPLAPIRCASLTAYEKCEDCDDEENCEIRKTMLEVRTAISDVLDKKSLADMANSGIPADDALRRKNLV